MQEGQTGWSGCCTSAFPDAQMQCEIMPHKRSMRASRAHLICLPAGDSWAAGKQDLGSKRQAHLSVRPTANDPTQSYSQVPSVHDHRHRHHHAHRKHGHLAHGLSSYSACILSAASCFSYPRRRFGILFGAGPRQDEMSRHAQHKLAALDVALNHHVDTSDSSRPRAKTRKAEDLQRETRCVMLAPVL